MIITVLGLLSIWPAYSQVCYDKMFSVSLSLVSINDKNNKYLHCTYHVLEIIPNTTYIYSFDSHNISLGQVILYLFLQMKNWSDNQFVTDLNFEARHSGFRIWFNKSLGLYGAL